MPRVKTYDRAYFDRWYHDRSSRIHRRGAVVRKVAVALATAEYLLGQRVSSVLDIGCGEAPWRAILKRLRPALRYQGVDGSEYVVKRYGRARNIRLGRFGALEKLGLEGPFDLIVCADVLHYVRASEARAGLATLAKLLGGVAWIEVFTAEDSIAGDHREFKLRSPAAYRRLFRDVGLIHCGNYAFVGEQFAHTLTTFERGR